MESLDCVRKTNGGGFEVEDLLNFSDLEEEGDEQGAGQKIQAAAVVQNSSASADDSSVTDHLPAALSGELPEPEYDELAELEWLSNFVDEGEFCTEDLKNFHLISGIKSSPGGAPLGQCKRAAPSFRHGVSGALSSLELAVPGKAPRSKRSRVASCRWSASLLSRTQTLRAPSTSPAAEVKVMQVAGKTLPKKKSPGVAAMVSASPDGRRRCLHCEIDRTPQWRAGPMGPKTLCNACGVRYKSGRLVPEYRPAASPTFVASKHSNSHRKVLELRRQKDLPPRSPLHHSPHPAMSSAISALLGCSSPPDVSTSSDEFLVMQRPADFRQQPFESIVLH